MMTLPPPPRRRDRLPRLGGLLLVLLVAGGLAAGCGGKKVLLDEDAIREELATRGVDELGVADFATIRLVVTQGDDAMAATLLENMPARLRDTPPWHYWKAVLATREGDLAAAYRAIQLARVGGGWVREHSYLAAWLELAEGNALRCAEICLEILDRFGTDALAWSYLLEAISQAPLTEGVNAATQLLMQRYPSARETRALQAIVLIARGESTTGRDWLDELVGRYPDDLKLRLLHLNYLRGTGNWKEFGRHAREVLPKVPPQSPEAVALADEIASLVLAARQREADPVPQAVKLPPRGADRETLEKLLPPNVAPNSNDPRDGMPADLLAPDNTPLYFLPVRANEIVWAGVRRDRRVMARSPEMEDAERDNRARHAVDLVVPEGTPVLAARGGVVSRVMAHQVASGEAEFERVVEVSHRDGTTARYWHLRQYGALVNPGDTVYRGQVIGASGLSGISRHAHLRFEVVEPAPTDYDWWEPYTAHATLPVRFADVAEPDGVPVEGRWYRSRNVFVPPLY